MPEKKLVTLEEGYRPKPGPNPPKAPLPSIKFPIGETGLVRPAAPGVRGRPVKSEEAKQD
jgi:hypothetical protein